MFSKPKNLALLFLFFGICGVNYAQQQQYGLPWVRNFSNSEYLGGLQTWSVTETGNGLLYFANNSGLLEFNGSTWTIYNKIRSIHRSVCQDENKVYVGAFNEFGYYEENKYGVMVYNSLIPLIKNKIGDFDEIWRIYKTSFGIVFQSFKAIFIYNEGKIEIINPPSKFHFSYYVNGVLWLHDDISGLMQYKHGKVIGASSGKFFIGQQIWAMIPYNDNEILISTSKNGVFRYDGRVVTPWNSEINEQLKRSQIYCAKRLDNNYFAFGTIQNGLIVTDIEGRKVLEINKERGLQNNTVLAIGQDHQGNIWLGLDNGISMIEFNSPLSYIKEYFDIGTGYASIRYKDYVYLGTNQGLFCVKWVDFVKPLKVKSYFRLIDGTEGQVWSLKIIDSTLFCGHNNGVFIIEGEKASRISSIQGAWTFLKPDNSNNILVGTYSGLSVLKKSGKNWSFFSTIKGFDESSRFLQRDQTGNIWVGQPYKGIYKLLLNKDLTSVSSLELFDTRHGLPSVQSNFLFTINSGILIATQKGLFEFNYKSKLFEKEKQINKYLDNSYAIDYIYQDPNLNLWYYSNAKLGVLRYQEDGTYKNIQTPFQKLDNLSLYSFENIVEMEKDNILFSIEGGFACYYSRFVKTHSNTDNTFISSISSRDTSEGIFRYNAKNKVQTIIPRFRYKNNSVSISFAANNFKLPESYFQYKLIGHNNDEWSEWTKNAFKEYSNLKEGTYTFVLRARNFDKDDPTELTFKFIILPPFYRTWYAWIFYLICLVVIIYFVRKYMFYRIQKLRLADKIRQREKFLIVEQKLREDTLRAENEMEKLQKEKLHLEMVLKEKELANSTMNVIQKNNTLKKLKIDLQKLVTTTTDKQTRSDIQSLSRRIEKEIDTENQWQVFNSHVEQVYEDLFRKLKERCPSLSPRELSLCAYLRMNISSKEIATLMNISARGVEISRYRVRKKLGLDRLANLTDFMMNL